MSSSKKHDGPKQAATSRTHMWGSAVLAGSVLAGAALGIALLASPSTLNPFGSSLIAAFAVEAGPSRAEVQRVLGLSGLTPQVLAAAGCSSTDAANLVDAAILYAGDNDSNIASTLSNLASAQAAVDGLALEVRSGAATMQDLTNLASAQTTLDSAESSLATLRTGIDADIRASLSTDEQNVSSQIVSRVFDGVPAAYGVYDFSEAELVALRDALAEERFVAEHGGTLSNELAAVLTAARAKPGVNSALSRVNLNFASIQAAWNERLDTTGL